MNQKMLLLLRKLTVLAKPLPGSILVLDFIHQFFFKKPVSIRVDDFDGDLAINLRLNEHMQSKVFWYGSYSRDILLILK